MLGLQDDRLQPDVEGEQRGECNNSNNNDEEGSDDEGINHEDKAENGGIEGLYESEDQAIVQHPDIIGELVGELPHRCDVIEGIATPDKGMEHLLVDVRGEVQDHQAKQAVLDEQEDEVQPDQHPLHHPKLLLRPKHRLP